MSRYEVREASFTKGTWVVHDKCHNNYLVEFPEGEDYTGKVKLKPQNEGYVRFDSKEETERYVKERLEPHETMRAKAQIKLRSFNDEN